MMKKSTMIFAAMAVAALSVQVQALPAYNSQVGQVISTFTVGIGLGQADVKSTVYDLVGGGYLYTYEISNASPSFTWFSVSLDLGVTVSGSGYVPGTNDPVSFLPVNSNTSVEAWFTTNPIGPSSPSSLLWFTSPGAPARGVGALAGFGIKNGGYSFKTGEVLIPQVPEPATLVLLSAGLLVLGKVNRKSC